MAIDKGRFLGLMISVAAFVGFLGLAALSSAFDGDFRKACETIAAKIADMPVSGKTIAVRPFISIERHKTLLGLRLQDGITSALAAPKKRSYQVVERSRLHGLDSERSLYWDDTDLGQWAAGLKADLVVVGTYVLDQSALSLEFRVLEPGGRVAGAGRTSSKADRSVKTWASAPPPPPPHTPPRGGRGGGV
jgi:hypothetical protein